VHSSTDLTKYFDDHQAVEIPRSKCCSVSYAVCNELRLGGVAAQYSGLAQKAAEKHTSFTDFVEELLVAERESRRARAREMFARVADFPAIKTLDQYDFTFATGAPRKQIMEFASLVFVERAENVVFLGPSGVGKTQLAIELGYLGHAEGLQDALLQRGGSGADAGVGSYEAEYVVADRARLW